MKFAIVALLGTAAAVRVQDKPARAYEYNEFGQRIPAEETVGHNNKDVLETFASSYVQQGEAMVLGLDGWRWNQAPTPDPETNYCTNANKATGLDQACSDGGNSAWNTHTSAVTKNPKNAQAAPYPDHPGVSYGVQGETYPYKEGGN